MNKDLLAELERVKRGELHTWSPYRATLCGLLVEHGLLRRLGLGFGKLGPCADYVLTEAGEAALAKAEL
jgi:hypothetical protein